MAQPALGLAFYRSATVLLLFTTAALSLALMRGEDSAPAPAPPNAHRNTAPIPAAAQVQTTAVDLPLKIVDLPARAAAIEKTEAERADISETYFASSCCSVHMHLLGKQQRCPLHLHRRAHEVSVVVSGEPEVLQVYPLSGELQRRTAPAAPGTLVYSPPLCGHAWRNRDPGRMQANLVFSAPPFEGNFYVEVDDPRLLQGTESARYAPTELLSRLRPDEAFRLEPLPIMAGRFAALLVRSEAELPPAAVERVLYVALGHVSATSHRGAELGAQQLVFVPAQSPFKLRAREPSVLFVFTPSAS
jgi:hypothetical protein